MSIPVGYDGLPSSDTSPEADKIRKETAEDAKRTSKITALQNGLNANVSKAGAGGANYWERDSLRNAADSTVRPQAVLFNIYWKFKNRLGNPRSGAEIAEHARSIAQHYPSLNKEDLGAPYENFFVMAPEQALQTQAVVSKVNALSSADKLLTMTTEQVSALVPYIKLYKMQPLDEGQETTNPAGKSRMIEIPFSSTAFGINALAGNIGIETILTNRDYRGADAGITDVKWIFEGTDPITANKFIKFEVTIFLSNISGLTLKRKSLTGETFTYADLIARGNAEIDTLQPIPKINAVVGWSIPSAAGSPVIPNDLKRALYLSRYSLDLNLMEHEFSFNDNGSCELNISYQASILLREKDDLSNILVSNFSKKLEDNGWSRQDQADLRLLESHEARINKQRKRVDLQDAKVDEDSNLFKLRRIRERARGLTLAAQYGSLVDKILDAGAIKTILLPRDAFWPAFNGRLACNDDANNISSVSPLTSNVLDLYQGLAVNNANFNYKTGEMQGSLSEAKQLLKAKVTKTGENKGTKKLASKAIAAEGARSVDVPINQDNFETLSKIQSLGFSGGVIELSYMHIGDLLDAGFEMLKDNGLKRGDPGFPNVVFGSLPVLAACQGDNTKGKYVNIVDIPVEVSEVVRFLEDHVVSPHRVSYSVVEFIYDIKTKLLPHLFYKSYEEGAQEWRFVPKMDVIHARGHMGNKNKGPGGSAVRATNPLSAIKPKDGRGLILDYDMIGSIVGLGSQVELINEGDIRESYTFLLSRLEMMFLETRLNEQLPSMEKDYIDGIYWLNLASSEGLIKGWSFSKIDAPYLAEQRIFGTSGLGRDISGGNLYNLNISMVGNGLFKPGSIVYVNPAGLGFNTRYGDESLGRALFIGGYYTVVKLDHEINKSGFSTNVELVFLKSGKDPGSKMGLGPSEISARVKEVQGREVDIGTKAADQLIGSVAAPGTKEALDLAGQLNSGNVNVERLSAALGAIDAPGKDDDFAVELARKEISKKLTDYYSENVKNGDDPKTAAQKSVDQVEHAVKTGTISD